MRILLAAIALFSAILINAYPRCPGCCAHTTDHVPLQPSAQELLSRNQDWGAHVNPYLLEANKAGQSPQVLFLACSDSRVDPALITASVPGEIFVSRTVANMIEDNSTMAAVAYAIQDIGVRDGSSFSGSA